MINGEECPYCGAELEINHDDGYGYDEDQTYQQECGSCGKVFVYTTSISFFYNLEEAPCLNGGEHKWKDVAVCPSDAYEYYQRCEYCDELRSKINKDYWKDVK